MNVRIGVAKRVHIAEKTVAGDGYTWGTSLCGWAGTCTAASEEPTCLQCKMIDRRKKILELQKKG